MSGTENHSAAWELVLCCNLSSHASVFRVTGRIGGKVFQQVSAGFHSREGTACPQAEALREPNVPPTQDHLQATRKGQAPAFGWGTFLRQQPWNHICPTSGFDMP